MYDKIVVLGSGPSLNLYKYNDNDKIFCPYAMKDNSFKQSNVTYFEMHEELPPDEGVICQRDFPLNDIIQHFNSTYFNNTTSYMIAYCLFKGVKELEIHGVDMIDRTEYINQRGSVMFWIGRAEGSGVKVNMPNGIMNPFLYGYEQDRKNNIIDKIDYLKKYAQNQLKKSDNEAGKQQYIGFIHALEMLRGDL